MATDTRRLGGTADNPVRADIPSAWYGKDLANDDSWIWRIRQEHVEELDAALRKSKEKGLAEQQVTKEDFEIPGFARLIAEMIRELEYGRGFVLMRGFPVERYDYADLRRIYWGIGANIGTAESQNIKGELIQEIADLGFDYTKSEHRGSMSSAELRPHCDPTDIVALLCLRTAKSGGESKIRSAMTIYNEVLDRRPEYLSVLHRGFHYELDGKGPLGRPDEVTHLIPVYSWHEGYLSSRFNQKALEAGHEKAGKPLSDLERDAVSFIGATAEREDVELSMTFEPGDIQWLNNYVIMHSRAEFEDDPDPAKRRLLLRLWLNHAGARPLDDDFCNRVLAGPRKGVIPRGATYRAEDMKRPA